MDEKALKTSIWQRVIIIVVAVLLLGSTVLTYMFIVMNGSGANQSQNSANVAEIQSQYTAKANELAELAKPLSEKYFKTMNDYRKSQVKSYNMTTVNNEILKTTDLKQGDGRELQEGDTDYMAYYIGWCADGSIFDSSFEYAEDDTDKETPIGLNAPLIASTGLIEGWNQGVVGMKLGGVRQLAISSDLAYGETTEGNHICGQSNSPLKFVVMALATDENIKKANDELNDLYLQLYSAMLGGSY